LSERLVATVFSQPPAVGLVESISKCSWALMNTSWEMSSAWASFLTRRAEVEKTMS
jgi:hypothetical protein